MVLCICSKFADAGVLSYTTKIGGTFDPTTPSTFTFTQFGTGQLSGGVNYNAARLVARWGGTGPLPAGGVTVTSVSATSPTINFGSLTIPGGTASGTNIYSAFIAVSPDVTTTNLDSMSLAVTIPTLTAADGFFLEFGLQFTDKIADPLGGNTNFTAFQKATALNSAAVPEPGSLGLGCCISLAAIIAYRRRRGASAA